MKYLISLTIFLNLSVFVSAQTLLVQPYIQNMDSTSVVLSWETDNNTESIVNWGSTAALGNSVNGSTTSGASTNIVHEVLLSSLQPDTRYYYKIKTGAVESDTFSFKTFPSRSTNSSVRIVAISDCQYDSNEPTKLFETINNGIIAYCTNGSGNTEDNLNLCLLVGDNVNSGSTISQWRNEFFSNTFNLSRHVCLLPVIGNHELNSSNYFAYFNLPQNGPAGYEEHTYFKDISNTRIIGFDSNPLYQTSFQLNWLSTTLAQTAADSNIDFVIFQEHHPYRSEMWLAGETDYARQVLDSLEKFNIQCGKPVVFLFGHTHGYSRGQMKDSKVVQINTATASGYIDTWGSTPQADYNDFNLSFDEYGFTVFEIASGSNPQMLIKRITRGDAGVTCNNVVQDSILLRPGLLTVNTPTAVFPTQGRMVHAECVNLRIEPFDATTGDSAGAVEFQVSENLNFNTLYFQNWKHVENWYYDLNTQADDTLYVQPLNNLQPGYTYYWRARYRTKNLDWSNWSNTELFMTSASSPGNLLLNPGAEDSTNNWTVVSGVLESLTDGECAGTNPKSGLYYFGIGGLCIESAYAEAFQDVDVSAYAYTIDAGSGLANWGSFMSDYAGSDIPAIRISFLDGSMQLIDSTPYLTTTNTTWTAFNEYDSIPPLTRTIRFTMTGTRNSGTDNDSYVDDLFLYVLDGAINCDEYIVSINETEINPLSIYPVPAEDVVSIEFGKEYSGGILSMYSVSGTLLLEKKVFGNADIIDCKTLSAGIYFLELHKNDLPSLKGKMVVK